MSCPQPFLTAFFLQFHTSLLVVVWPAHSACANHSPPFSLVSDWLTESFSCPKLWEYRDGHDPWSLGPVQEDLGMNSWVISGCVFLIPQSWTGVCVRVHWCVCVHMHWCVCVCTGVCARMCTGVCARVRTGVFVCVHMRAHVHVCSVTSNSFQPHEL